MASDVDVCNSGLQLLGAKRISALTDQTPSARACSLCYSLVRQSELRKYDWNFSVKRASLAADVPAPTWGRANSFTLPSDYLSLTNSYPEDLTSSPNLVGVTISASSLFGAYKDWVIEGRAILTNDGAPLNIRYIADITDTSLWDAIFVQVMAGAMAVSMCEELTQSNTKKADVAQFYKQQIEEAKKANSFDNAPQELPPDSWLLCRS